MLNRKDALKTVVKFTTIINVNKTENGINKIVKMYSVGTGFFMCRDNNNNKIYIITAAHVAKLFNNSTYVEMMGQNNNVITKDLSFLQNGKNIVNHSTADLCAIEIDYNILKSLNIDVNIFKTSLIDTNKIINLSRDVELTTIGFPRGLGVSSRFEPLTFRSYSASNIINNVSGLDGGYSSDIFVLENPACGGYSGGPVLDLGHIVSSGIIQSSKTVFYGVMHGTISDDTGGKMAVVTPASYILQII